MKKLGKFINNNIVGFILGAIIFGGSAAVIAGTVASSDITYTNNSQSTVEGALNDLYEKANKLNDLPNFYQYWTDNWSGTSYAIGNLPSSAKPDFSPTQPNSEPLIRTTYNNGTPSSHSLCFNNFSTRGMFCIETNYWKVVTGSNNFSSANANSVKSALSSKISTIFGSDYSCETTTNGVKCSISSGYCSIFSTGLVECADNNWTSANDICEINSSGVAKCYMN